MIPSYHHHYYYTIICKKKTALLLLHFLSFFARQHHNNHHRLQSNGVVYSGQKRWKTWQYNSNLDILDCKPSVNLKTKS